MTRNWNHRTLLFVGPTILLAGSASLPAQSTPPGKVAPAQRDAAVATKLVAQLRSPKTTADERKQIIAKLLELGEDGPRKLAHWADDEYTARLASYGSKFERGASDVIAARVKSAGGSAKVEAEVGEIRKTAVATSRNKNLTKDQVKTICDPAIEKLSGLMTVTPEQVAEAKPELKAMRDEVIELARLVAEAIEKVPADKRKGLPEVSATPAEETLAGREAVYALLATPMTKADRDVLMANLAIAPKIDAEEAAAIADLNRLRILLGIGAMTIDPKLCDASRGHSKDMVEKAFFDHSSPIPGKETPWKRAALFGTSASGENIYMGSTKGVDAIKGWWYSPGHHLNMMGGAKRVGVGRHAGHFTQMFGG
jgi:uncharacterized protein YkwD